MLLEPQISFTSRLNLYFLEGLARRHVVPCSNTVRAWRSRQSHCQDIISGVMSFRNLIHRSGSIETHLLCVQRAQFLLDYLNIAPVQNAKRTVLAL